MTPADLVAFRARLKWSQARLGAELGMSVRGILCLEKGVNPIRRIHVLALERLEQIEFEKKKENTWI